MFSILFVSAALLGAGVVPPAETAAARGPGDPAVTIRLNDDGRYQPGDRAKVSVETRDDGYLLVVHVDPDRHVRVLFPLEPGDDPFVRAGKRYDVKGRGGREAFTVDGRPGRGTVYAAVSPEPFHFDRYATGGHWDLRALDSLRVSEDVEAGLNEFVRTLSDGHFQYDLYPYDVSRRVVYASPYYDYWGWGWPFYGGPRVFFGLGFGRGYRPFYGGFRRVHRFR